MSPRTDNALGDELRRLRESRGLTQATLSRALGTAISRKPPSDSLISLWERGETPLRDYWLDAYAVVFDDTVLDEVPGADLRAQLQWLRERASGVPGPLLATGQAWRSEFWRFDDGQPITVVATPMYTKWVQRIAYADPFHPNFIESLRNADMDATFKLVLHLTRTNPESRIEHITHDRLERRHLTGHIVVLGGADTTLSGTGSPTEQRSRSELSRRLRALNLPLFARLPAGGEDEYDTEFVVLTDEEGRPLPSGSREEVYAPAFATFRVGSRDERELINNYPQLEHDIGLLVRQANPLNSAATLTICSGVFSRGTLGAVAATTDSPLAERNERFLRRSFGSPDGDDRLRFWILFRVAVERTSEGVTTVAPELSTSMLRGAALT